MPRQCFFIRCLLTVLILLVLLILLFLLILSILILTVVLILLILITIFHIRNLLFSIHGQNRNGSIPARRLFILGLKNQSCKPAKNDRCADTARCCGQATGENAQESLLLHALFDTLCKQIAKAR